MFSNLNNPTWLSFSNLPGFENSDRIFATMKGLGLLMFLLCLFISGRAQESTENRAYRDTVQLVTGPKLLASPFKKWRLDFTLDARQTIIGDQAAKLGGLRIGMEYRRIHRFGLGFFGLSEGVETKALSVINSNITIAQLNLNYSSLYYERILFFNRRWEWSVAAHIGNGTITGRYQLKDKKDWIDIQPIPVKPLEFSTSMYYNMNWWISVGTGIGYRHMRQSPAEARNIYNAPILVFKLKLKFGKLIKGLVNRDVRDLY